MQLNRAQQITFKSCLLTITSGILFLGSISCKSPEQHADSAFDILKQKKETKSDSIYVEKIINQEPPKIESIEKQEIQDEWSKFRSSTDKKIKANDLKIEQISKMKNADDKVLKHLNNLKTENNELRRNIDDYKEEEKVRWENFKTTTDHNINVIEIELKDISINTKNH